MRSVTRCRSRSLSPICPRSRVGLSTVCVCLIKVILWLTFFFSSTVTYKRRDSKSFAGKRTSCGNPRLIDFFFSTTLGLRNYHFRKKEIEVVFFLWISWENNRLSLFILLFLSLNENGLFRYLSVSWKRDTLVCWPLDVSVPCSSGISCMSLRNGSSGLDFNTV